jgi:hypothetical protein
VTAPLSDAAKLLRGSAFVIPIILVAAFASRAWVSGGVQDKAAITAGPLGGEACTKVQHANGGYHHRCVELAFDDFVHQDGLKLFAILAWLGAALLAVNLVVLAGMASRGKPIDLRLALTGMALGVSPVVWFLVYVGDGIGSIRFAGIGALVGCGLAVASAVYAARTTLPRATVVKRR